MAIPNQLTFEGREVSASKCKFGDLGEMDFVPPKDGRIPQPGDRVRTTVEWVCIAVNHPEKHDSDGNATDTLKRVAVWKPLLPGFSIDAYKTREDVQAVWDEAHQVQEA